MTLYYGCHDRAPFAPEYLGVRRSAGSVTPVPVWIKNTGTKTCQYTESDLGKVDLRCDGCNHKQAVAHVDIMQEATNSIAKNGNT